MKDDVILQVKDLKTYFFDRTGKYCELFCGADGKNPWKRNRDDFSGADDIVEPGLYSWNPDFRNDNCP